MDRCSCKKLLSLTRSDQMLNLTTNYNSWDIFLFRSKYYVDFFTTCGHNGNYRELSYFLANNEYMGGCKFCKKQVFSLYDLKKIYLLEKFSKDYMKSVASFVKDFLKNDKNFESLV